MSDRTVKSKFYSVSSNPGTFGKTLYNAAFRELGIDAVYIPKKLDKGQLKEWLESKRKDKSFKGVSLSMPFKKDAYELCDRVCSLVENINTIKVEGNELLGYNTDCEGFTLACNGILEASSGAVIYGTGAVSDSIIYALTKEHIPFKKIKRQNVCLLSEDNNYDFLINTTPIGMQGIKDFVFTEDVVNQYKYVFDVVVNQYSTNLMKIAKKLDKKFINAIYMYMYQLYKQFKIYTNMSYPIEIFKKEILDLWDENYL